jgi:hypothetical protein
MQKNAKECWEKLMKIGLNIVEQNHEIQKYEF